MTATSTVSTLGNPFAAEANSTTRTSTAVSLLVLGGRKHPANAVHQVELVSTRAAPRRRRNTCVVCGLAIARFMRWMAFATGRSQFQLTYTWSGEDRRSSTNIELLKVEAHIQRGLALDGDCLISRGRRKSVLSTSHERALVRPWYPLDKHALHTNSTRAYESVLSGFGQI
ncbi:hypothetical protein OH77DRAFT_857216 [Trametes cingulata]|nr:hypothetical protein OH77DRAFT_857216 [Trametes cingulata]